MGPLSDVETELGARYRKPGRSELSLPGLTLLYHPSAARIGECTFMDGERLAVARAEPVFVGVGRSPQPVGTTGLSRQPFLLLRTARGVRLEHDPQRMNIAVDGVALTGSCLFDNEQLERGVTLLVNCKMLFLLHYPELPVARPKSRLVGSSTALVTLLRQMRALASTDAPVLLRGESGTGKQLVAEALHEASARRDGVLRAVNMASVPADLAATELFGHSAGAFSGARSARPGLFQTADGGTLLLDEIGHAPLQVQRALLRVLETGEVIAVGESKPRYVDVRVISATDLDIEAALESDTFHAALLERLGGAELHLPPLRARRDDIARLLVHFLRELMAPQVAAALLDEDFFIPPDVVGALTRYHWPRNVRQLRNVAREIALMSGRRPFVPGPKLARILDAVEEPARGPLAEDVPPSRRPRKAEVCSALAANDYSTARAARSLGISQQAMYRLMDRHDILYARRLSRDALLAAIEAHGDLPAVAEALQLSLRGVKLRARALDVLG